MGGRDREKMQSLQGTKSEQINKYSNTALSVKFVTKIEIFPRKTVLFLKFSLKMNRPVKRSRKDGNSKLE